ncbi:Myotubularin-related protein 7 [Liparis tanakae]|uniref:Myotubularin-related protein 7 n=1 Tax=Liparis tanakae TaxID=230148 RepID=A0A4Z2GGR4_9TELE|nr:Myotubularin-related protein 7 [Liparis tanakae]
MHPRQSVEDYLSAIQEETQQLEEQLASHKQKIAQLEQDQDQEGSISFDRSPTAWALGRDLGLANTPQDYAGCFVPGSPRQPRAANGSPVLPTQDSNLSSGSDQESGIGEDSARDPDSDEAA